MCKGEKPWGRKGEACNTFIVSLPALLRDNPPNYYQKHGRASIINLVKEALPPMPFPFTVEMFKDSLRLYVSPYGQIADTIQHTFPKCDCIDESRGNKPSRHVPCVKPAVCIVTSIYTDEEAARRDLEEDEYISRFQQMEEEIRVWALTQEGRKMLDMVVNQRKDLIRDEIKVRKELHFGEQIKLKVAQNDLTALLGRKKQFEDGLEFVVHRLKSVEEALEMIQKDTDRVSKHKEKLDQINTQMKRLKDDLDREINVFRKQAIDDIIQKYCAIDYNDKIKKFRVYAIQNNLRRPWDGVDGLLFEAWRSRLLGSTSSASMSLQDIISMENQKEEENQKLEQQNASALKNDDLPPEYDWSGCEKMSQYDFLLWYHYLRTRSLIPF